MSTHEIKERLEYLRGELRAERLSWGDVAELQGLASHIAAGDVELLEAAGVPEFPAETSVSDRRWAASILRALEEGFITDETIENMPADWRVVFDAYREEVTAEH